MKAKRLSKTKNRRIKTTTRGGKSAAQPTKRKKGSTSPSKPKRTQHVVKTLKRDKTTSTSVHPVYDTVSPFSAITDERTIAYAWDVLGDEDFVLDDEIWSSLYSRIKLQLLQTSYSFRLEDDATALSPYSVTPMPAFRGDSERGFLKTGNFTVLRPELPGVVFDLKISANEEALLLDWSLKRKDDAHSTGHIALYLDGGLVEAANLNQSRCQLELTRDDLGDISFYFLDAETGRQIKILEFST